MSRGGEDAEAGVQRLLDWTGREFGAQARLIRPDAPWRRGDEELYLLDLEPAAQAVAEVAKGSQNAAVEVPGGLVLAVGRSGERRELLVALLTPLVSGLIAAGSGVVAVIEAAPAEAGRSALALEIEACLEPRYLTVLCPVSGILPGPSRSRDGRDDLVTSRRSDPRHALTTGGTHPYPTGGRRTCASSGQKPQR